MVSQCAGCNTYDNWAALLIGLMAGLVYESVHALMLRLKLDDPLDAVAVHAGGGILGVICAPIFKSNYGIFWLGAYSSDELMELSEELGLERCFKPKLLPLATFHIAGLTGPVSWSCPVSLLTAG